MIKNLHSLIIGGALAASLAWFCFSCSEKSDAAKADEPEQIATVNPDLAGKGHNDCLDIFYDKWQALKTRKAKQTRAGGDGEELPPDPGDDDEITKEELEEIMIETLVEYIDEMDISEEECANIQEDLNNIIEYSNNNPDEDTNINVTENFNSYLQQLNIVIQTRHETPSEIHAAVNAIEQQAKTTLSFF